MNQQMDHCELDSGDGRRYFCKKVAEMNYQELQFGAKVFDPMVDQPCVIIFRQKVERMPGVGNAPLRDFFNGSTERHLSRKDLFDRSRRPPRDLFALSVLLWGFPTNQHGICQAAFQNWQLLIRWVNQILTNRNMTHQQFTDMIPVIDAIPGLGISSFSKFLYFCRCSIAGHRCLILDDRVAKGINKLEGDEFKDIREATRSNRHRNYSIYPQYLALMERLAINMDVSSDSIEYILWKTAILK